jgi:putative NADPH-quinone reductase
MTKLSGPSRRRALVVVTHPVPDSLIRAALDRTLRGLERSGAEVRLLDLDAEHFDPVLSLAEVRGHFGQPEDRPDLAHHFEALRWSQQLVLVYPTWNAGQPARLKGWFDRVWMNQVAFELPAGSNRIRGRLNQLTRIDIVTSHGSSRWLNFVQGNAGRLRIRRNLRVLCHLRARSHWHAVYGVDNATPTELARWLDRLEDRFAAIR